MLNFLSVLYISIFPDGSFFATSICYWTTFSFYCLLTCWYALSIEILPVSTFFNISGLAVVDIFLIFEIFPLETFAIFASSVLVCTVESDSVNIGRVELSVFIGLLTDSNLFFKSFRWYSFYFIWKISLKFWIILRIIL